MRHALILILAAALQLCVSDAQEPALEPVAFPFKPGDRVAWIGSSSTAIGQYCQCEEFLLRTRHPELKLVSRRFSNVYMDTFAKCADTLPGWLGEFKPTVVFFQYGGNDSVLGAEGLGSMKANATKCVAMAREAKAKVFLITPQGVDRRKLSPELIKTFKLDDFNLYAEKLIVYGHDEGWTVLDTHHALTSLLDKATKDDPQFTFTADKTHMTLPGYVAWGYILYGMLNPPPAESIAELSADGTVLLAKGCRIHDVEIENGAISFTREDEFLPIMPPVALPPRAHVSLEKYSRYVLKVTGLPPGNYALTCEGKPVGETDATALESGVNMNSLLLDGRHDAPWAELSKQIWNASKRKLGQGPTGDDPVFQQVGKTKWKFGIHTKV
jgi:hypothetical protein